MIVKENMKIVFAGDSITDAGASNNQPDGLGDGYPRFIRDYLYSKYPELNLQIINRGISGERTSDLLKRFESSVLASKPDILSICIGTNDVWRQFDAPDMDVIDASMFEENIRKMICLARNYSRDMPIVLFEVPTIEPGYEKVYPCSAALYNNGNEMITEYNKRVYKLACEFNTYLCPINKIINSNINSHTSVKYTKDGVHPNCTGAMTFALSWCSTLFVIE